MSLRLKDIARLTGVSASTVSRVINGDPRISPETSRKVKGCLVDTGYTLNTIARSLKTKRTYTVGFLAPELVNDFFMNIAEAAESALRKTGYSMFICNSKENLDEERRQLALLAEKCVDGILWIPVSSEGRYAREVRDSGIPIIAVDRMPAGGGIDAVLVDNTGGSREAVNHILDSGYSRVGFIGGDMSLTSARERYEGYCLALSERGVPLEEEIIRFGDFHVQSGYDLMSELIGLDRPPEYIFIANYYMHIGAAKFLSETGVRGIDAEGTARIAHFDDMEITSLLGLSSLTIRQPMEEIGRNAADLLIERIESAGNGGVGNSGAGKGSDKSVGSDPAAGRPRGDGTDYTQRKQKIIRLATRLIDHRSGQTKGRTINSIN